MVRLIDADKLTKKLLHFACRLEDWGGPEQAEVVRAVAKGIKLEKTVDAVEVVRCKDCKWYMMTPIDNVPYCSHESGYCGEHMGGLFFCACGERRTDG
jgi:hypothetical protein